MELPGDWLSIRVMSKLCGCAARGASGRRTKGDDAACMCVNSLHRSTHHRLSAVSVGTGSAVPIPVPAVHVAERVPVELVGVHLREQGKAIVRKRRPATLEQWVDVLHS